MKGVWRGAQRGQAKVNGQYVPLHHTGGVQSGGHLWPRTRSRLTHFFLFWFSPAWCCQTHFRLLQKELGHFAASFELQSQPDKSKMIWKQEILWWINPTSQGAKGDFLQPSRDFLWSCLPSFLHPERITWTLREVECEVCADGDNATEWQAVDIDQPNSLVRSINLARRSYLPHRTSRNQSASGMGKNNTHSETQHKMYMQVSFGFFRQAVKTESSVFLWNSNSSKFQQRTSFIFLCGDEMNCKPPADYDQIMNSFLAASSAPERTELRRPCKTKQAKCLSWHSQTCSGFLITAIKPCVFGWER